MSGCCSTACSATARCSPARTRSRRPGASAPRSSTAGAPIPPTSRERPPTNRAPGDRTKRVTSWLATDASGAGSEMSQVDAQEVAHASGLHAVNRALNDMHHEMLRVGGRSEGAAVRLSVLNLVAACVDVDSADLATRAIGRLGAKHPVRAIIVLADPEGKPQMEADISLQCSAVDAAEVCAEQVRMVVGGEAAYHLASVVTPLLVPDIPTYLWLVGSPPLQQAFGQDAVAICERLILDSGAYDDDAGALRLLAEELDVVGDALSVSD